MNRPTTKLNWDTDVVKHYIRRAAWLPALIAQSADSKSTGRKPKYLTFCAAQAIDVFLFLREGLLTRDTDTDSVLNTYFCEKDATGFNTISQLIGAHEQGFFGDFQDMILFEEDELTKGFTYADRQQRYGRDIRRRLSVKARHQRFKAAIPFDVVNLDICGTFFPPSSGLLSPMLKSLRRLFKWQTASALKNSSFASFTIFLTTHVECGRVSEVAMNDLVTLMDSNRSEYSEFSRTLEKRFGTSDPRILAAEEFSGFYCIALPKMIVNEAFKQGWTAVVRFSGQYQRERSSLAENDSTKYSMLAWVGQFSRNMPLQLEMGSPQIPNSNDYAATINDLADQGQEMEQSIVDKYEDIKSDLAAVVAYREGFLNRITTAR